MRKYTSVNSIICHRKTAMTHARRRARERLGINLSIDDVKSHCHQIAEGFSTKLGNGADQRELHWIIMNNRSYFAVWCPAIHQIVTYLQKPKEWLGSFNEAGAGLVASMERREKAVVNG